MRFTCRNRLRNRTEEDGVGGEGERQRKRFFPYFSHYFHLFYQFDFTFTYVNVLLLLHLLPLISFEFVFRRFRMCDALWYQLHPPAPPPHAHTPRFHVEVSITKNIQTNKIFRRLSVYVRICTSTGAIFTLTLKCFACFVGNRRKRDKWSFLSKAINRKWFFACISTLLAVFSLFFFEREN